MANLETIKALNLKYKKNSSIAKSELSFGIIGEKSNLNEGYNTVDITKAYLNAFTTMGKPFVEYFDKGLPADVAMLYIDICSFSSRFSGLKGTEIGDFFDEYYDIVIPIIYAHGGEIDKIMGDGIICSFGPPFYNYGLTLSLIKANNCASEIIEKTVGGKFESKIAFHAGTINYFKNKSGLYNEFTMIGKPLTELFRLEGITEGPVISFFDDSEVSTSYVTEILIQDLYNNLTANDPNKWKYHLMNVQNLKGVEFERFYFRKLK